MVSGIAAHIASTTDTLGPKWLIYMTNQGILFLTIHYIVYAGIVSARYFTQHTSLSATFPFLYSVSWGLQIAFTTVAIFITIIYWGILNAYVVEHNLIVGAWMNFLNVFLHAINSVSCIFDLFITARPIFYQHVYLPIAFGFYYMFFSLIYWAAGGTGICRCKDGSKILGCIQDCDKYIYPILDWEDHAGNAVLMIFVSIVAILMIQGLVIGLYKLRVWIHDKVTRR